MNTETPMPTKDNTCKNCHEQLQGEYCHHCGQQDKQYIRSMFAVVGDLFGEIGHWDSRFYRTLVGLFFKPGFLSLEFVRGRHASYVPPLRLYFFISLVSFMVLTSLIDFEVKPPSAEEQQKLEEVQKELEQSIPEEAKAYLPEGADISKTTGLNLEETDLPLMSPEEEKQLENKIAYLMQNPQQFSQKLVSMTPQMMLLMLPFWALFLKLIYLFGHRYYLEHLTVALHTHAFILLTLMLVTVLEQLTTPLLAYDYWRWVYVLADWVGNLLLIWLILYLLLTQKRFYQQSWPFTIFKFLVSGVTYLGLLAASFVIMVIIGILSS